MPLVTAGRIRKTPTPKRGPDRPPRVSHGGARTGAGRKPSTGRGAATRVVVSVNFAPDEILEIDGLCPNTTRAAWLRELALREVRHIDLRLGSAPETMGSPGIPGDVAEEFAKQLGLELSSEDAAGMLHDALRYAKKGRDGWWIGHMEDFDVFVQGEPQTTADDEEYLHLTAVRVVKVSKARPRRQP